jgi:hypothetical protein
VSALVKLGVRPRAPACSAFAVAHGEWRSTPVNPLTFEGEQFLVAPRGETQWVRNLRAAGSGASGAAAHERVHRRRARRRREDPVLRAYLQEWAWEVGAFFDGVGADSSDEQLAAIAPKHPIFRITAA